ncbi:PEP-CTERM sorting domain-containing protein [Pelotalea chapellei]|uniref:PEP-CTERM sorting domain-containing protein n=1 Tax=Pelotalea chapellei TaxID=44671 RepID=A0ABS5U637_9BACT|nr:PEP-CTERM sorting domain-containing protein [Pelotalea chapellei]MBT1071137.1 PEP-CTERM sorting domain-containing protein [Pelotalea chapellei]
MRSACEILFSRTLAVLMLTVLLVVGSTTGVRASLITNTNGDFLTGDLTGWNATGNVDVVSYSTLPQSYVSNWDLSSWNSVMKGNFALVQFDPTNTGSNHLTTVITTGASVPTVTSFNYAVAWEVVNPLNQPVYEGYFRIEIDGKNDTGKSRMISYRDYGWVTPQNGPAKGVLTGSAELLYGNFEKEYFTEYSMTFNFFNPNLVMSAIVGLDDVALLTEPAPVGPAPVPEPASAMMLAVAGLAGMAGWLKKRKKSCK